jgi:CRP-like cAMP-binding protein
MEWVRRVGLPNDDASRSNRLLNALPKQDYQRLHAHLRPHAVQQKQDMGEAGGRISEVHFPVDAVVSILTRMDEGPSVEIATIGNEGVVGLTVAWGSDAMNPREVATVQAPGSVVSMDAATFRDELHRQGALASLIERYTLAFFSQVSQQVACNGLHSVEQRCARWLLLTHDRVGTDEFPMTHEFLSQMLGVRRASVTVTAGILQRAGFVEFSRGRVAVVDRAGLESAACECYAVTREVYDRLLP